MPKGQKLIDWTPKNNAKLMLTILVIENIYPNCEKVAVAFSELFYASYLPQSPAYQSYYRRRR